MSDISNTSTSQYSSTGVYNSAHSDPRSYISDPTKTASLNALEKNTARFIRLPLDFQKAIHNFDYDKTLVQIHRKYRLHIDQTAAIESAVMDIVFGDIHSQEIIPIIMRNLHTTQRMASEIALDISDTVLKPIREGVKKVQDETWFNEQPLAPEEKLREVM